MKLVYVTHTVTVQQRLALVVRDEDDLRAQLEERRAAYEAGASWVAKPQLDKTGKEIVYHQLSQDWPPYP